MKRFRTLLLSLVPTILAFGIQFFLAIFFVLFGAIIATIAYMLAGGDPNDVTHIENIIMDSSFNGCMMISFSVICTLVFGLWYYSRCNGSLTPRLKQTFHPLKLLGILFLIPATQFLSTVLIYFIYTYAPSWLEAYNEMMESAGMTDDPALAIVIYSVLCAPVSEELIFRGVTMQVLKRNFPFWFSNLFQALLFGMFHGNMVQGIYAFVLGLFLGYVCEYGGSIWYSILFHFLFNLWGNYMNLFNDLSDLALMVLSFVGMLVFGLIGLLLYQNGVNRKKPTHIA